MCTGDRKGVSGGEEMTCTYQNCADCPHRPKSGLSAKPFDRDVAMRSLEYSAVRLGMHWSSSDSDEIEIAAMPDIFEVMKVAPVNGSVSLTCENAEHRDKKGRLLLGCSKIVDAEALQARARMLREPCAAVIAREGRS